MGKVVVTVPGKYEAVTLLTPDGPCAVAPRNFTAATPPKSNCRKLKIYSLLVLK